jgi:hypothetical protein
MVIKIVITNQHQGGVKPELKVEKVVMKEVRYQINFV